MVNTLPKSVSGALAEIRKANPVVFETMMLGRIEYSLLQQVQKMLNDCGFDLWFYQTMEGPLLRGNFDVLYLDDRVVGNNPKRMKAQKEMARIRKECNRLKAEGIALENILSFS